MQALEEENAKCVNCGKKLVHFQIMYCSNACWKEFQKKHDKPYVRMLFDSRLLARSYKLKTTNSSAVLRSKPALTRQQIRKAYYRRHLSVTELVCCRCKLTIADGEDMVAHHHKLYHQKCYDGMFVDLPD